MPLLVFLVHRCEDLLLALLELRLCLAHDFLYFIVLFLFQLSTRSVVVAMMSEPNSRKMPYLTNSLLSLEDPVDIRVIANGLLGPLGAWWHLADSKCLFKLILRRFARLHSGRANTVVLCKSSTEGSRDGSIPGLTSTQP